MVAAWALWDWTAASLVGWVAVGQHRIHTDDPADGVGDVGPVSGHRDHALDAGIAKAADHSRCVGADHVFKQKGADGLAVDCGEHDEGAVVTSNIAEPQPGLDGRHRPAQNATRAVARGPKRTERVTSGDECTCGEDWLCCRLCSW